MSDDQHPYTEAFDDNGVVYVSGALSMAEDGAVIGGRREALDAALDTLRRRLATVGLGLKDVVKTTYFVTDVSLRTEANDHYAAAFEHPRPARSFVEVSALPYGATVEIEAIARRP